MNQAKRRGLFWIGMVFLVVGAALLVLYWNQRTDATKPYDFDPNSIVTTSNDEPSESDISDDTNLTYPADQPKKIILDPISVSGYIQKVGTDPEKNMATPNSIYLAGWYTGSVKPGDFGLSIINGHVGGRYRSGIFKELEKLQPDQIFIVQYGDNSIRKFQVVELKKLPTESVDSALFTKQQNIEHQLNLITCAGRFDGKNNTYEERLIVVSKKID